MHPTTAARAAFLAAGEPDRKKSLCPEIAEDARRSRGFLGRDRLDAAARRARTFAPSYVTIARGWRQEPDEILTRIQAS